jgi:hypothetical protein
MDAPLQHIAYPELAADPLHIDRCAPVGEGGVACDHEAFGNPREIGGKVVGDPVREILLLRVVGEVGKRQHDDRKARREEGLHHCRAGRKVPGY